MHFISEPPTKPLGEEMSESDKTSKKKRKKDASSSVADEGLRGLFTRMPLPGVNGHAKGFLSARDSDPEERERLLKDEDEEEEDERETQPQRETEREKNVESRDSRFFQIRSVGDSEMSASGVVARPVIKVTVEDGGEEGERRERGRMGEPIRVPAQRPAALAIPIPSAHHGIRVGSFEPRANYGSFQGSSSSFGRGSPSHSPATSPNRRRMRKTISGELI